MSEWEEVELRECVSTNDDSIKISELKDVVEYWDTGAVTKNNFDLPQIYDVENLPSRARRSIRKGDSIISSVRPNHEHHGLINFDPKANCLVSTGFIVVRPIQSRIEPSFLYNFLRLPETTEWLQIVAEGSTSTYPSMKAADVESLIIQLPSLKEQEAIAEVLSSLDDKIDLLKRQNKTLEGMTEALFRQWFIEEAQDDWEEVPFGEVFDFTMGQSPPGNSFNEEGIGVPMYQGNADFGMRFPSARVYTTEPKRMAGPGDVLMSVRAPVGAMNMAKEICCIGRGVAAFRFKEFPAYDTYTLYKIKAMISDFMVFNEQGTVFGSIGKGDLLQMVVMSPPINIIEKFEAEAGPMDHKIRANANEIELLEKMRDTLLPKLMSGEVRVNLD